MMAKPASSLWEACNLPKVSMKLEFWALEQLSLFQLLEFARRLQTALGRDRAIDYIAAWMAAQLHQFNAIAFEENFNLRRLAPHFPGARTTLRELRHTIEPNGAVYVFPFGAIVTNGLAPDQRDAELKRLHTAMPKLTAKV